jgi:hypothetical protein
VGWARWAEAEHGRRRGGVAVATACWRSRRGAGEHGQPRRARAPGGGKGVIPVLKLAEEVAEDRCRRWGGPRASPARSGTGLEQFRRRRAGSWTGSGRGASGGGEEAVGSWNLGGVEQSRRIPARSAG